MMEPNTGVEHHGDCGLQGMYAPTVIRPTMIRDKNRVNYIIVRVAMRSWLRSSNFKS
jgi:hypothetical protein